MQKSYLCNKQTSSALMRTFDCFFPIWQIDDIYAARRERVMLPCSQMKPSRDELLRSNCCFKSPSCCSARRSPLRGIAAPPSSSADSAFPITASSKQTGCRCGMWTRPMCARACVRRQRVINGGADVSGLTSQPGTPHFLPVMEMRK